MAIYYASYNFHICLHKTLLPLSNFPLFISIISPGCRFTSVHGYTDMLKTLSKAAKCTHFDSLLFSFPISTHSDGVNILFILFSYSHCEHKQLKNIIMSINIEQNTRS